jgi:N-acetylglucosaminyldiphosphoundecaprenol N-acetyl-beta-D-mannosaminyltransferase
MLKLEDIKILDTSFENVKLFFKDFFILGDFPLHIITFNLDFFYNSTINEEFKSICRDSNFVVPDGKGITDLLRIKYYKRVKRITGNELFEILLHIANDNNLKVAFIGSCPSVQSQLSNKVNNCFPNLSIAASISPPLNFESDFYENEKTIIELGKNNPDIVFVALGSPRQELWISQIKKRVGAKIYMGVGSVFDFYTGGKKRAPVLLQRAGFEWIWRMLNEPGRLIKRYICDDLPFFMKQIIRIKLEQRIIR